ncbi:MAG: Rrf2 family transcriptional regulator [Candidatus Odyssella sp.]|nr:Rrf2 family transcriptional regulator [Candidatus Odyssella sp.]
MKLQKATQFALYSVLELALDPERQSSAAEIAEKYGISNNHLAKVLRDLGRAGLVESTRGVGGGYRFSGNAKRTTLLDIIEMFEDIGAPASDAADRGARTDIGRSLHPVLNEIEQIARATLDSITIETLVNQIKRNTGAAPGAAPELRAVVRAAK